MASTYLLSPVSPLARTQVKKGFWWFGQSSVFVFGLCSLVLAFAFGLPNYFIGQAEAAVRRSVFFALANI